ncbi:MAG: DUF883 family protein [Pseudomonadota bacterium]
MTIETNPLHSPLDGKKDSTVKDWRTPDADLGVGDRSAMQEKIEARMNEARSRLHDAGTALASTTRRAADATQSYVTEHPWKAIALAATAGLVAALLIRRH